MAKRQSFQIYFAKNHIHFRYLKPIFAVLICSFFSSNNLLRASLDPMEYVKWEFVQESISKGRIAVEIELKANAPFRVYEDKLFYRASFPAKILEVQKPATHFFKDPLTGSPTKVFTEGRFKFLIESSGDNSGSELALQYVACTEDICSRPIQVVYKNSVIESRLVPPGQELDMINNPKNSNIGTDSNSNPFTKNSIEKPWTLAFLTMIFLAGLATNLTPCVYPMIPITLRVMAIPGTNPFISAFAYSFGIVVTYTFLGVIAASSGSLFGSFLASPVFSLSFSLLMAFFGFSMLGFGDLSFLQNIGSRFGSGKPSPINTFAMGAGAGLVAAPCTGPILAALITWIAKSGNTQAGSVLLFVYSLGFALPYLLLGNFAKSAAKVKVPPGVQIFTKYLFATVMFTLSAYYARIPFYKYLNSIHSFFPTIAIIFSLLGLAFFSWGFSQDGGTKRKKYFYSLSSLLFGFSLFFVWQSNFANQSQVNWYKNEEEAFLKAHQERKPVFIDAWAEWCEACKKMDTTTLSEPSVVAELNENWISLKLDLTENSETNETLYSKYGIQTLPSYVFIPFEHVEKARNKELDSYQVYNGYLEVDELFEQLRSIKSLNLPPTNEAIP